jgi:thioester reductase-like protein
VKHTPDLIAILGCGIRLPGGIRSLDELWSFLVKGGDAVRDLPENRWLNDLYDPKPRSGWTYVRRAGYLDNLDQIDISFLNCSPREALQMDPQQRLLVETAFEALETAGVPLETIARSRTAVLVGISSNDFSQVQREEPRFGNAYTNTGGAFSIAANRISYLFDLRGPSLAVDTACSSGLTALDMAVKSIQSGASDAAIVGAVNCLMLPETFAGFCAAQMLSPAAQCRAFDANGEGFVRAEGAVSFFLKPLEQAMSDQDPILAVIRGSDCNNDGRTPGLSLPNGDAQAELIERVFRHNDLDPSDVVYVEAHGTGTTAGDPIEAAAIGRAIAMKRSGKDSLPVGSIKTNIGHVEPAAGLAGLVKAILCLNRRAIPPSLHFEEPNPAIDFEGLRIEVVTKTAPIRETARPALVAINSFGFGGANAHVVVAEPPEPAPAPRRGCERPWFMVSGRSDGAMREAAGVLSRHLGGPTVEPSVCDLSANLLLRRTWHSHRAAIWADTITELRQNLDAVARDEDAPNAVTGTALAGARPVFVFTGNGPQWWGMGRQLLQSAMTFRDAVSEIDSLFREVSDLNLLDEMTRDEGDSRMALTEIAQPALFALQVGLVRCLEEDGLIPSATFGHSAGELAAAYCSGLFDLRSVVRIVSARSEQQGKTAGVGTMAAIGCGLSETEQLLSDYDGLVITADNAPQATTVAGPVAAIEKLVAALDAKGRFARKLALDYAFHSPAMDPVESDFRSAIQGLQGKAGHTPFYSTVTGGLLAGERIDVDYWWQNIREPVMFRAAVEALRADGHGIFVEIGPHPNLLPYISAVVKKVGGSVRTIETLRRGEDERAQRRKTIAAAAVAGSLFDRRRLANGPVAPLSLPTYPWQYERFMSLPPPRAAVACQQTGHAFLGQKIDLARDAWHQAIALSRIPIVADHIIRNRVLFPAAGFFEIAVAAALSAHPAATTLELRSVRIDNALPLDDEREVALQTFLDRTDHSISVQSRAIKVEADTDNESFTPHLSAVLEIRPPYPRTLELERVRTQMNQGDRSARAHYELCGMRGLNYGPTFQTVSQVTIGGGELLATLVRQSEAGADFHLDPTQIDGALQAMIGLMEVRNDRRVFLPVQADRIVYHASTSPFNVIYAHVVGRDFNRFYLSADLTLTSPQGQVLVEIEGLQVRAVGSSGDTEAVTLHHVLRPLRAFDQRLPWLPVADLVPESVAPEAAADAERLTELAIGLARVCSAFTTESFAELAGTEEFRVDDLVADGRIAARHARYASLVLDHAVEDGFVSANGDGRFCVRVIPDAIGEWRTLLARFPQYGADCFMIGRTGIHQKQLLRGEMDLLDVLFPKSGSPVMEQVYEQGVGSVWANMGLAAAVAAFVARTPLHRRIRILEIGGGVGGTTAHILRAVPRERIEYVFTDVSSFFLSRAERRFKDAPFFHTAILDLNNVEGADIQGPFDVIVAANVIHVAPSLRSTLSSLRNLLRDGGWLGLVEQSPTNSFDFVFPLLPGVWNFKDHDDRPNHALMTGERWVSVLQREGFDEVGLSAQGREAGAMLFARKAATSGSVDDALDANGKVPATGDESSWLIIDHPDATEPGGESTAQRFALQVRSLGHAVTAVTLSTSGGGESMIDGDGDVTLAAVDDHGWRNLCERFVGKEPSQIVVFAPHRGRDKVPETDAGWPLVALIKGANAAGWSSPLRFSLVSRNAMGASADNLSAAAYLAVGRAVVNEQPNWTCRRIDFDGSPSARGHLFDMLLEKDPDTAIDPSVDEIQVTAEGIMTNDLDVLGSARVGVHGGEQASRRPFLISLRAQGSVDYLVARETTPAAEIAPGAIEVDLKAAGLNFKDVILSLGMLPPDLLTDTEAGPKMGLEGAGVVSRVGEGVSGFAPGDAVMLMADGCFASSTVAPAEAVHRIPSGWSYRDAATLPVVGLTVVYALEIVANLSSGETLLVHGGAGGIGLMAIQYAKAVGAKIIATAGSDEKRDLLCAIGVDCVSDSRSLAFDADTRAFTKGQGVDVVLNSLTGDAMLASLDLLKPFGRFVEIGKRDFEANNRLNLKALERNISYTAVDLTFLPQQKPELFLKAWQRLLDACNSGAIRPLPYRTFPVAEIKEALRLMQAGGHVGKLVIDLEAPGLDIEPLPAPPVTFSPQGVHVITGGLGGVGLKLGQWMAQRGAAAIALVGRKGVTTEKQSAAVAAIEAAGACVRVVQADVADRGQVEMMVEDLIREFGTIRGVAHCVLVLKDGLMANMTHEDYLAPIRPKVNGAYHLDRLTRSQPLDYFIAFSSVANLVGNPGQANYVAANAYIEQLAVARRAAGLPGLVLALGAVGDTGILTRETDDGSVSINEEIAATITTAEIIETLDHLLPMGQAVAALTKPMRSSRFPIMKTARVKALGDAAADSTADVEKIDFAAVAAGDRPALMEATLTELVAKTTGINPHRVDPERSLLEMGLDSLMAVEFGLGIERRLGVSLPRSDLSADRSIRELSAVLLKRMNLDAPDGEATDPTKSAVLTEGDISALIEADLKLPDIIRLDAPIVEKPLRDSRGVFLTGATGYLGAFLVDELLRCGAPRVVCLVRGRDDDHAAERLVDGLRRAGLDIAAAAVGDRVEVWNGDFAAEHLRLSSAHLHSLEREIDVILHNGASVNFMQDYRNMRNANVLSVRRLLEIASSYGGKAFHFVSTLRVFANREQIDACEEIGENVLPDEPPGFEDGYVHTKWAADRIAHAARDRGLPVGVYRPSFVIGRTTDGFSSVSDLGSALVKFAFDTGVMPDVGVKIPVVPVDSAARRIVAYMDQPGAQFATRHISDWPALSTLELQELCRDAGLELELLPLDDFIEHAVAFFAENPSHPAIWLPVFFKSGVTENRLGSRLRQPVMPSGERVSNADSRRTIGRMLAWFEKTSEGAILETE